ncbi:MAG TPA: deoxyribose-phosphate aldolase [Candidatus Binatia bacterium]|nr:deoxyribose-phosphate aldolase [Candidatus Binatia bacterium]
MTASVRRAVRLEHRLTQPNASLADLEAAVALAAEHELAALTVNPWLVKAAKRRLGRSRVTLGTVVGYPNGGQLLSVKAFEASKALEQGATQIDFVINGGALSSGDDETVFNDMLAVVDMAHSALASVGVIVEAAPLTEELVRRACHLAERAGADFVVTSPGTATVRSTITRTRILRDGVGPRIGVKACGPFRSAEQFADAASAGATRVSAFLTPALARSATEPPTLAVAGGKVGVG